MQSDNHEALQVLRLFVGGASEEAALHERFSDLHLHGEWHSYSAEMAEDLGLTEIPLPAPPPRRITDAKRLIDAVFGDYKQAIALLGVARSTLSLWEAEGIPALRWKQMVEISRQLGRPVTLAMLSETVSDGPNAPPVPKDVAA